MKKIMSIILTVIIIITMTACDISKKCVYDNELIDIAMEISKEENNYTYWLFSNDNIDSADIIQVETKFIHNGEEFSSFDSYVPVSEFENIEDFISKASKYLSSQYLENYLYKLIGLHPTESIATPLLLELKGSLYKITSANGVSIIPNLKYEYGEIIERTDSSAIVRLYVDSSIDTDISFFDYPLILEDNVWKHNPSI